MAKQKVKLSTLGSMNDGTLDLVVTRALEELGKDCVNRPELTAERQLSITFAVKPNPEGGTVDQCLVSWRLKTKRPPLQSREYAMQVHANGALLVNEASPESPRQRTLDEAALDATDDDIAEERVNTITINASDAVQFAQAVEDHRHKQ